MDLDVIALDHARSAWRSGNRQAVESIVPSRVSIGAALEFACWARCEDTLQPVMLRWGAHHESISRAWAAAVKLEHSNPTADHDAPLLEICHCPDRNELAEPAVGVEWRYFLDRFSRSLRTRLSLPSTRSNGLAAGLYEMVDNVVQHSGLGDAPNGIVGYQFNGDEFSFAVADIGRGIRASLNENPKYENVQTDSEAIVLAVTKGASRRVGESGRGFSDLLRYLADMEGQLWFRSGTARLRLDGRGVDARRSSISNCPNMQGFQLSVTARPRASAW